MDKISSRCYELSVLNKPVNLQTCHEKFSVLNVQGFHSYLVSTSPWPGSQLIRRFSHQGAGFCEAAMCEICENLTQGILTCNTKQDMSIPQTQEFPNLCNKYFPK